MDEFTTSIVGIDFPNADKTRSNRRMEILLCAPGDRVTLRREPKNPHDSNAVGVWSERDIQLGYISAERAPMIGRRLQAEETSALFQAMHQGAPISASASAGVTLRCRRRSPIPAPRHPRPNPTATTASTATRTGPNGAPDRWRW
ncbi:HIRAN domain-containing protein [Sphingomonas aerolata]|uniref:HIRAN domain-containing protein n=1 Tax=Sphingomonas aerolata TaxID=185951 RepID=UPI0035A6A835